MSIATTISKTSIAETNTIDTAVRRIVEATNPRKVILFGSYARGEADPGSDLDLLVVKKNVADPYAEMVYLRQVIGGIGIGVDILIYSEEEVARRGRVPGTLLYWALQEGKLLYDAQS